MGTRSYIALQIEEDEYLTIFCHYNGYPDDNGAILAEHYDKQEKVESLIQLGDLYFLRSKLEPNPDLPHNHSTPQPNVTIAYNRDEGWSDCEAVHKTLDELNDPGEIGIEFTYIFTFEGRWIVDTVLSHTCPYKYIPREAFLPMINQDSVDDSTEKWLDNIESRLYYERWYCGHWHISKRVDKLHFLFHDFEIAEE